MSTTVGILNIVLGIVYVQYGTMTVVDMKRGWKTLGFTHFGAAWIFMAFTCGPHHIVHGIHALNAGRDAGGLDLAAVLIGYPAGVGWFLLRLEAFTGGRGDRFIPGTPRWLHALPVLAGAYVSALVAATLRLGSPELDRIWLVVPNVLLIGIYGMIGFYLLRTQISNRPELGGWSASGLALGVIFPTCAVMHLVFALYGLIGRYGYDVQGYTIDWLAVPAGIYFLWVVRALYRESLRDWELPDAPPAPRPRAATVGVR
jgi:hypothetical protein